MQQGSMSSSGSILSTGCCGALIHQATKHLTCVLALHRSSSLEEGPAVEGQPVSAETAAVVEGPATSAAAARHARTGSRMQAPGFRAVTYNILADQYASSDYAQTHLFAYCPTECALVPAHACM